MKKLSFFIQKSFIVLLIALPLLSMAQFTPNAAGAPDEPIPEPGIEGASCETAVNIVINEPFEYTFEEGQEEMYFTLNSDSNALFLSILEDNSIVNVSEISVYELIDCNDLTLVYNEVVENDSFDVKYYGIDGLNKNSSYLFRLFRDPNEQELTNVTFSILMQEPIITPCPSAYSTNCSGFINLVPNGGFNYFSWYHSSWDDKPFYNLFHYNYICDWRDGGGSPDLVFKYDKTYAHMWSQGINYESIVTTSNFNIGAGDYMFSVDLAAHHSSSVSMPDGVRLILKNTVTQVENTVVDIPASQFQRTTPNSMNFKLTTACFNITQSYNRLIFRPYNNIGNSSQGRIYVDNLSIVSINSSFDAGSDILLNVCDSAVIGPSCVLPGATYSWTPINGLSNPNVPNPLIGGANSGIYTLSMTTACSTYTDQVSVNLNVDEVIPDGQTSTWLQSLHGSSHNPERISGKNFLVEGEFIINSVMEIAWCDFIMVEGAKITIAGGGKLYFHGGNSANRAMIRPCQPDKFWDGIYVSGSAGGHADFGAHTVIRNSINGIVFEDGSFGHVGNVKFVNNGTSVTFKNYSTMYPHPNRINYWPLDVTSCEFSANSYFADEFGYLPTYAVKVINYNLGFNDSYKVPLIKWNTFNGTGGGLYIENSNVKVQSNGFHGFYKTGSNFPGNPSRSDLAIRVKGSQTVSGSKGLTINSNTFNNCYFGIETEDNFIYRIRNNTFNGSLALLSETGPGTNFLKMSNNFSDADPSTTQNQIENNTIKNVEKGIILETVSEFSILDNTFDMEVQALPSSYPQRTNKNSRAVYVNNYDIPLSTYDLNTPRYISRNQIKHSKVGIQSSFVSSLTISENNIFNSNDNMSSTCPSLSPFTCPPLDPFGIRVVGYPSLIEENEVSNELSLYTNNQPYQQSSDMMVGISVENTAALATMFIPGLYCNKIENTGVAMRFLGSNTFNQVLHNTMENHYYGFMLKNNGYVGRIGNDGDASDNEWNGSYTGSETFADNSDGSRTTLFVQSGGVYDPYIDLNHQNSGIPVAKDNSGNYPVSLGCSIPVQTYQDNSKPKQPQQNVSKSGGGNLNWGQQIKRGKMPYMIHASDSALMLDRQLLYYHLSKDTALLNDKKWKTFADSMKLTPMGRSMRQSQSSRSAINNFEANLVSIDSIATKIENKDTLSQSDTLELKRIADLCPYYDGIAVYKARYLLHKLNLTVVLNDCERTQVDTSQKYIRLKSVKDTSEVSFSLYPNPSQEWVTVEYSVEEGQEIFFELYDVLGKRHFKEQMKKAKNHRFNLEGMHQGMYFYRLVNDENILKSGKLLIQK